MISYWSEVTIQLIVAETSERATSCTMSAPCTLIVQVSDLQRLGDIPAGFKHGLQYMFDRGDYVLAEGDGNRVLPSPGGAQVSFIYPWISVRAELIQAWKGVPMLHLTRCELDFCKYHYLFNV